MRSRASIKSLPNLLRLVGRHKKWDVQYLSLTNHTITEKKALNQIKQSISRLVATHRNITGEEVASKYILSALMFIPGETVAMIEVLVRPPKES